jgi:nucleolar protein 56
LIYHSSFIGKTGAKSKGRISRFLANKCSIASRIDNFSETPTSKFGEALKRQVEERIEFYASGAPPAKNAAVMQAAMNAVMTDIGIPDPTATATEDVEMADGVTAGATEQARREKKEKKEKKKDKKSKSADEEVSEKKSKKDKKRKADGDDGESKKKKKSSKA